jgi:hypothetical protein
MMPMEIISNDDNDDEFYDCDVGEEYGEVPLQPQQEEFIVLLEENGRLIKSGKYNGRRLSALSKKAWLGAKAAAKKATQKQTYNRKFCCKVMFVIVVGLALIQVSLMIFRTESNNMDNPINDPNDEQSKNNLSSDNDILQKRKFAFDIAQKRFRNRLQSFNKNNKNNNQNSTSASTGHNNLQESPIKPSNPTHNNKLLNSIRIPEAGSSFLSVIARALVGCQPDGYG